MLTVPGSGAGEHWGEPRPVWRQEIQHWGGLRGFLVGSSHESTQPRVGWTRVVKLASVLGCCVRYHSGHVSESLLNWLCSLGGSLLNIWLHDCNAIGYITKPLPPECLYRKQESIITTLNVVREDIIFTLLLVIYYLLSTTNSILASV